MLNLAELETQAGLLWPEIKAHLDLKSAALRGAMAAQEMAVAEARATLQADIDRLTSDLAERAAQLAATEAARDAAVQAFADYRSRAEPAIGAAKAVIADPGVDDAATISTVAAIIAEIEKPVLQRQREALEAQIAELEAKKAALQ